MSMRVVAAALLFLAVTACTTAPKSSPNLEPSTGGHDDPDARDRWYWEQRTYPTGSVPLGVHREAVQRELATARLLADGETQWTSLGPAPILGMSMGLASEHNSSGRALTLAIHPTDANTLILGTAQGGIWKSTDRGASWRSIGERTLPTLAINVIKYKPGNPDVLYAGTGEPNSGSSIYGAGLLKSNDGGETWTSLPVKGEGWNFEYGAISGLHFDARDPNTIYITTATIASPTAVFRTPPNAPPSGFFKSTDGGESWTLLREATRHPVTPSFGAGFMDLEYGGAAAPDLMFVVEYYGGILKSTDAGQNWRYVTPRKANGLGMFPAAVSEISYLEQTPRKYTTLSRLPSPEANPDFRRAEVTLAPSNPQILYAGYDAFSVRLDYDKSGVYEQTKDRVVTRSLLFKSVDGGETWEWLGDAQDGIPDYCTSQCVYDNVITVNPSDANDVWIGGSAYYTGYLLVPPANSTAIFETPWRGMVYRSRDGGRSWQDTTPHCARYATTPSQTLGGRPVYKCAEADATRVIHPDIHGIVLGPGSTVYVVSDGGVFRTSAAPPTAPPGRHRAAGQPAFSPEGVVYRWENLNNDLSTLQFYRIGSHPTDANILLGGMQDNSAARWDGSKWDGWGGGDGTIAIFDPKDPRYVYLGTQFQVHRHDQGGTKAFTEEAGWHYSVFPGNEVSLNNETTSFVPVFAVDPVEPTITYGGSNQGIYRSVVRGMISTRLVPGTNTDGAPTSISVSPRDHNIVWVGTTTGVVYRFTIAGNGTATMTRLDVGLPDRYVSRVVAGHDSPDTVYAVFNGYDANTPQTPGKVFISTDRGLTWRNISAGLPDVPATTLALDPNNVNRMWLGTDTAVFVTYDRGETWESYRRNMPVVSVMDLDYNTNTKFLVAATHGRGIWRMPIE